jgi:hypothetical protein
MGLFDLFGSSSSSSSTSNSYTAQVNPVVSGAGNLNISPLTEGGGVGNISANNYNAPLSLTYANIVGTDAAQAAPGTLSALAGISAAQAQQINTGGNTGTTTSTDPLTSFVSANWIYLVFAAVIFLWGSK